MDMLWLLLLLIAAVALLAPILAISALVRVRRLEQKIAESPGPEIRGQVATLRQRLTELERRLATLSAPASAKSSADFERHAAQPKGTPAAPALEPTASQARAFAASAHSSTGIPTEETSRIQAQRATQASSGSGEHPPRFDLETLIAGQWLNRIGILALLFAIAFFLKYAFDNQWIGNRGRIIAGLLSGGLLIVYSGWLLRRGYRYFSEGIAGLGVAILYLSLYTGWGYYNLFSQHAAFAGMIFVTAVTGALAMRRNSQSIAALGLIGGFLTPILLSTGRDEQLALFTYLAVLNASLLGLAQWREWRSLELLSFFPTQLYLWGWFFSFYEPTKLVPTLTFAALFYVLYNSLIVIHNTRTGGLFQDQLLLLGLNNASFLLLLSSLLWPERRIALTLAVLTLAMGHLIVGRFLRSPQASSPAAASRLLDARALFTALALFYSSLAVPIWFEGTHITIIWAVKGATLVWAGLQNNGARLLRRAGLVLFALSALRLLLWPNSPSSLVPNGRFIQFAVTLSCFAFALYLIRRRAANLGKDDQQLFRALGVAGNALAVYGLSLEVWDRFGWIGANWFDANLAQQLGLSLTWTLYASGLIAYGVRRKAADLRWLALGLFGLTVGKVFLYDVWLLERAYRIASFVALGVVLLIVSFLYQRRLTSHEEQPQVSGSPEV